MKKVENLKTVKYKFARKRYREVEMKVMFKLFIVVATVFLLSGCAKFKKPGDTLIKSPCEVCKQKPFYVNGKRV